MSEITAVLVDDEPIARRRMSRLLASIGDVRVLAEAGDVSDAVEKVRLHRPDLLLLDVRMPGGDGFDVLTALKGRCPEVIFVTAFGDYALPAFAAAAVDYVTKPVDAARLSTAVARARTRIASRLAAERISDLEAAFEALQQAMKREQDGAPPFWVRSRGRILRITASSVTRIEAERDYSRLHADGEGYLLDETLASLERRLPSSEFIRVHRSTIVRTAAIKGFRRGRYGTWTADMTDGAEVRIGRRYVSCLKRID